MIENLARGSQQASAESDALRAEVAALRALPDSLAIRVHGLSLTQALATVPAAKVADAVKPDALPVLETLSSKCVWNDVVERVNELPK